MTRRLVNVTLDNLDDLPVRCRRCVFWELDPVSRSRAEETGDTALEKEAWVSAALLEWGSCGKIVYVDGVAAGYVLFAPPAYVPRSVAFPTSPVSADAVLLMSGAHRCRSSPAAASAGCSSRRVAKELLRRGVRAIEAFGDLAWQEPAVRAAGGLPAGGRLQDGARRTAGSRGCGSSSRRPRPGARTSRSRSSGCSGSMTPEGALRPV